MLRTNLQFSGSNLRVILFTSSIQDEGKSETSFQLAISFTKLDKKVLYIDADMRKSVFTTKHKISEEVQGLSQFLNGLNTEDIIYKTNIKNLNVVFAGPYAPNPAELLYDIKLDEFIKRQRLNYDYIIIDSPPSLSLLTDNGMIAANYVLLPVQAEFYALEGLGQLLETMKLIRKGLNPKLDLLGVLLTMVNPRTTLSTQVHDEIKKHFPDKTFRTTIPRNVRLAEAPSHGVPVGVYDRFSKGSRAYKALTKELEERISG